MEFGVQDGTECNTRYLREKGWNVLQMDSDSSLPPTIKQEFITVDNINALFAKYDVPKEFDFLCIDIDFNDFWVWKAISADYRPRLVVIEYNASIAPCRAQVVPYRADGAWQGDDYFGGSLLAMYYLAREKGYELVYCCSEGVNAFFVRQGLVSDTVVAKKPADAYRPPGYDMCEDGIWLGHARSGKEMLYLDRHLNVVPPAQEVIP